MTIIALRMGSWDEKNYTFTKFSHCDLFEGRLSQQNIFYSLEPTLRVIVLKK